MCLGDSQEKMRTDASSGWLDKTSGLQDMLDDVDVKSYFSPSNSEDDT